MRKEAAAIFRCAQIDCSRATEKNKDSAAQIAAKKTPNKYIFCCPAACTLVLVCFTRDGHNKGRRSNLHFNARTFYII
jgi:hypothetical protein